MNNYDIVGLYDHNVVSYEKIKKGLLNDSIVSIVHATGTGKSYNALQLAYDNKDKKITYIVTMNSIIEHLKEIIENNPNLDFERDFYHLEFRTYQSLINMSEEELKGLDIDLLILDEFHHVGAPIWGSRINKIVESHENMKILGMTAYTVRDRGTPYERDVVKTEANELFSGSVVSNYDLCDAMIDGVLPKPIYKSGYVYLEQTVSAIEERLEKLGHDSKNYKELSLVLKDVKKRVHEAPNVKDVFKTNIKSNGKYIYFCPFGSEQGKNDINTIMEEAKNWIHEMGLSEVEYEFYVSLSEMGDEGKRNRKAFYNDEDLNGNKVKDKLRIMFAINQYNEGVHVPDIDGVIMGRETRSDIIFFEQLGRALSVRGKTKEEYDELYSKSLEELVELCNKRKIKIDDVHSKEEVVERLIAPIIIDLANNIRFIKELENNLKDRVKEIQLSHPNHKRIIRLGSTSFDIEMINEDLYKILRYMNARLTMTWYDMYSLAKSYYEHYGNLEIPVRFRTINGYEEDENGVALGRWINTQRRAYNGKEGYKITEEQINLLEEIGMRFEIKNREKEWYKKYELAKAYYEHYGDLKIPVKFRTINGYEEDENGIALGAWIDNQRKAYNGKEGFKITEEQIKLLEEIGMRFDVGRLEEEWYKKYELVKIYYEHYDNLEIPVRFKTINGYEENENGVALGAWICNQRKAYNGKEGYKITEEQIKLLEEIGMRFDVKSNEEEWYKKYELAKIYYEHYGDLKIPVKFRTINGYEENENGIALGAWIGTQRKAYNGKVGYKITEEQIKLLEEIGMRFDVGRLEEEWYKKYELAKIYYEHYGNLKIPFKFKTINGYEENENGIALGAWIDNQRKAYNGKEGYKITEEQINLLEEIGMRFEIKNREKEWYKKYELAKIYYEHYGNLEIPFRFKTINGYEEGENGVALGTWIQSQKAAYNGEGKGKITEEQIKLLEEIGINWLSSKKDMKSQMEYITKDNTNRKKLEVLNRIRSYLHLYNEESLPSKEEINQGLLDNLNRNSKER